MQMLGKDTLPRTAVARLLGDHALCCTPGTFGVTDLLPSTDLEMSCETSSSSSQILVSTVSPLTVIVLLLFSPKSIRSCMFETSGAVNKASAVQLGSNHDHSHSRPRDSSPSLRI